VGLGGKVVVKGRRADLVPRFYPNFSYSITGPQKPGSPKKFGDVSPGHAYSSPPGGFFPMGAGGEPHQPGAKYFSFSSKPTNTVCKPF